MPDSLISLTSPAEPSSKAGCRKKTPKHGRQAGPSATIAALASAETARVLPSMIFHEADQIEIGMRRAKTSCDLVWGLVDELDVMAEDAKKRSGDIRLDGISSKLYLLLGIASDELDAARGRADKITDAARELKHPTHAQPLGTGEDLLSLRLQLKAAEDAVNEDGAPEDGPLVDAYHAANERFLEAPARTPSEMLLKLERLAEIEEIEEDSPRAAEQIVLNLIRDLRAGLGIDRQAAA